jgi:hypothetical protein
LTASFDFVSANPFHQNDTNDDQQITHKADWLQLLLEQYPYGGDRYLRLEVLQVCDQC